MKNFLLLFLLLFSLQSNSQIKKPSKGDFHYKNLEFPLAISNYSNDILKTANPSQELLLKLANSYSNINDYSNAKTYYEKLFNITGNAMKEATFIKYIESKKASQEFKEANNLLKEYYHNNIDKFNKIAIQKEKLDSLSLTKSNYTLFSLAINSTKSDFAPAFYKNAVIFSSARDTTIGAKIFYKWNNQPYLDMYVAERNLNDGTLFNASLFLENLKTSYHEGTAVFSKDFKTIYYSENAFKTNSTNLKLNKKRLSTLQIVKATIENNKIINKEILFFNNPDYSCSHPALSEDEKFLYFVSDMPGGYGSTDIYYIKLDENTDNRPINLGSNVNTAGREMFPLISDNKLFFTSDGHYGLGGLDLFESKISKENEFALATNLGAPMNSNLDDFSFIYDAALQTGYFASNRVGGKGDDDLYYFKYAKQPQVQYYSGLVLDDRSKLPIPNAKIEVYDEFNELVSSNLSESNGYYKLALPIASKLKIIFSKPEYSEKEVRVQTDLIVGKELENNTVYLIKYESLVIIDTSGVEKIDIKPIYFKLDKWDITVQAEVELEKVMFAMNNFPKMIIKIESHTDSRGSDIHNLKLSDKRAKSTSAYLIAKGIAAERIVSAIGYGETKLQNNCKNGVKCSEKEHLANRRSDFIVISK